MSWVWGRHSLNLWTAFSFKHRRCGDKEKEKKRRNDINTKVKRLADVGLVWIINSQFPYGVHTLSKGHFDCPSHLTTCKANDSFLSVKKSNKSIARSNHPSEGRPRPPTWLPNQPRNLKSQSNQLFGLASPASPASSPPIRIERKKSNGPITARQTTM